MTTQRQILLVIAALTVAGISVILIKLLGDGAILPRPAMPPADGEHPSEPLPKSSPAPIVSTAAPEPAEVAPTTVPSSAPTSRPEPFTFEGRTTAEIMAEFKDIPETEGQWSVGQISPLWISLDSFHSSETKLVIDRYLEDYYDRFLSPAARVQFTSIDPDLGLWPGFAEWMRGALDLKMQLMRKWNTVAANLQKLDWVSRATEEEIFAASLASFRLQYVKQRLDGEIDRRGAALLRKKVDSAPATGR